MTCYIFLYGEPGVRIGYTIHQPFGSSATWHSKTSWLPQLVDAPLSICAENWEISSFEMVIERIDENLFYGCLSPKHFQNLF
jgi:hypothetical protein